MPHLRSEPRSKEAGIRGSIVVLAFLSICCMQDFGVGPAKQQQTFVDPIWAPVNGAPGPVSVTSLISSSSGLWALAGGNVFRSTTSGGTWERIDVSGIPSQVLCLASDSSGTIIAGVSAPTAIWQYEQNSGVWRKTNAGLEYRSVTQLVAGPTAILLAGTPGWGVFRSTDSGLSWNASSAGISTGNITILHRTASGRLYAGTPSSGLYASADTGTTWSTVQTGSGNHDILAICSDPAGTIFLSTSAGLFCSSDGGSSWIQTTPFSSDAEFEALCSPRSGLLIGGTGRGVLRSQNEGRTWEDMSEGLVGISVQAILPLPDRRLLAGTMQGLFYTRMAVEP